VVLGHVGPEDRLAFASQLIQNLDDRKLLELAKTPAGTALLRDLRDALKMQYGVKHAQAWRIDSAIKTAPHLSRTRVSPRGSGCRRLFSSSWNAVTRGAAMSPSCSTRMKRTSREARAPRRRPGCSLQGGREPRGSLRSRSAEVREALGIEAQYYAAVRRGEDKSNAQDGRTVRNYGYDGEMTPREHDDAEWRRTVARSHAFTDGLNLINSNGIRRTRRRPGAR